MPYRTKTYIAAEWDGDSELVDALRKWNESEHWGLSYLDAHELGESRDSSLNCTIKDSLGFRLARSKTFVLVVGENTATVTAGACRYCNDYVGYSHSCCRGRRVDNQSYIEYECGYAARNIGKIVVLYNYLHVDKSKCPEVLRTKGVHIPAYYKDADGKYYWDYRAIRKAIGN